MWKLYVSGWSALCSAASRPPVFQQERRTHWERPPDEVSMAAVIPLLLLLVVQTMLELSVCHFSAERRLILLHPGVASSVMWLIFRRIRWFCDCCLQSGAWSLLCSKQFWQCGHSRDRQTTATLKAQTASPLREWAPVLGSREQSAWAFHKAWTNQRLLTCRS